VEGSPRLTARGISRSRNSPVTRRRTPTTEAPRCPGGRRGALRGHPVAVVGRRRHLGLVSTGSTSGRGPRPLGVPVLGRFTVCRKADDVPEESAAGLRRSVRFPAYRATGAAVGRRRHLGLVSTGSTSGNRLWPRRGYGCLPSTGIRCLVASRCAGRRRMCRKTDDVPEGSAAGVR
jgi:hypothetical protein